MKLIYFLLISIHRSLSVLKHPKNTHFQATSNENIEDNSRKLQGNSWHPMNTIIDTSHLNLLTPTQLFILQQYIFPPLLTTLSSIKVQGFGIIPGFNASSTNCSFNSQLIANYSNQISNTDLVVFIMNINSSSAPFSSSVPCGVDFDTNRPLVGIITINLYYMQFTFNKFRSIIYLFLKQFIHIMALNSKLLPLIPWNATSLVSEQSTLNPKVKVKKIASSGIVSLGKTYFNCSTFSGLYLEDENLENLGMINWEKKILGNDLMVADYPSFSVLSSFTLTFLNDTKWYWVNFTITEFLTWGNNEGCGFLGSDCSSNFNEFCESEGKITCSSDFISKSICASSKYSNECLIRNWYNGGLCTSQSDLVLTAKYEIAGAYSRCFDVKIANKFTAGCYVIKCIANYLNVIVQDIQYTCSSSGQVLNVADIQIICPNITQFCGIMNTNTCPNDCSGNGVCQINKVCNCHPFFNGAQCANKFQCNNANGQGALVLACSAATNYTPATLMTPALNNLLIFGNNFIILAVSIWLETTF